MRIGGMSRTLVWIVVPWLAACGRLAFEGVPPGGDDEPPVGGCPLALNLDRAQIQEQLVDFPLLVRLGSEHLDRTQLQPDARNLGFYLDGVALAYEIEDAATRCCPPQCRAMRRACARPGRGSSGQRPPRNDSM
jgi:hypothetical protein